MNSATLLTPDGLAGLVFLLLIGVTLSGALIAVLADRLIRAVTGLAFCFLGVSGLYYFLNSPFVAVMELLIYVGAVCVTIVFGIMLAEPRSERLVGKGSAVGAVFAFLASGMLFFGLAATNRRTHWPLAALKINGGTMEEVGRSLLTTHSMVFELISIVLLVAIIGSLVLARNGRGKIA